MGKLLIRLDDITPTMNHDNFDFVVRVCKENRITTILGVVPDNQDPVLNVDTPDDSFWRKIKELESDGFIIAQHGYQHIYSTKDSGLLGINPFSEFAGETYPVQHERLLKGKNILEGKGIHASMFMAPGHTFDKNTLKALKELGFKYITDGYSEKPYSYMGLSFIPCRTDKPYIPKNIDTICLHINSMSDSELQSLAGYISSHRDVFVSSDIKSLSVKNRTAITALDEKRNLRKRKLKQFVGSNEDMQKFMQKTANNSLERLFCFIPVYIKAKRKSNNGT